MSLCHSDVNYMLCHSDVHYMLSTGVNFTETTTSWKS